MTTPKTIIKPVKKTYCIFGYSLDSAYLARELANRDFSVEYYITGELGYPYDLVGDYFSYEDCLKMRSVGVDVKYECLNNSTHVFVPYDELKMVNSKNGLISYPFNRSSFESAEELEQIEMLLKNLGSFNEDILTASNPLNVYKSFFPKWLYESVLKNLGSNKWGNIKQNKFTASGIIKEINISTLDSSHVDAIYRPTDGFVSLCRELLNHPNIKSDKYPIEKMNGIVIKKYKTAEIIVMDNRIDYICKYAQGLFERVIWTPEANTERIVEEFIDIDDGIVFTPNKDYWCITNKRGKITKLKSTLVTDLRQTEYSIIAPTVHNHKTYLAYKKMMGLYSGKMLKLGNSFYTTIL